MDIILEILKKATREKPDSNFLNSLHQQYCERGGLSKKQLEGLYSKIEKIDGFSFSMIATLEAIILKKPTRYKSEINLLPPKPASQDDEIAGLMGMLEKFPQHKRLLFFKAKLQNREKLSPADLTEIEKFKKLLM